MALVREPMVYVDGFDAELSTFDALGYGHHDALFGGGVDAVALFGGYASAEPALPCGASTAYVPGSASWTGAAGVSVLAFDNADRAPGAAKVALAEEEDEDCDEWIDAMDEDQSHGAGAATPHPAVTASIGYDAASGCFSLIESPSSAGRPFGLLFPSTSSGSADGAAATGRASRKRTYVGAELQAISSTTKKQCVASRKTSKARPAPTTPPKDPQNLVAKNRRERISERLRTLQELVPNGTKVDMVTMLEKAISYVKFLQLQVKVLATDEFWPAEGGKAPEITRVKEALDTILSSQMGHMN